MEGSNSIINMGDLSKPANTLVEKISDAIGGVFKPWQIRRVAQAEAEAEKIKAVAQIEITELQHRAMQRFLIEEAKKQNNIESITSKALPLLNEDSNPAEVEDDWITNFFDKCRLISDEEMQALWSKVLAGESNSPGKYSKRTIDLLASMDKKDAELFKKLCGYCLFMGVPVPFIYEYEDNCIYDNNGLSFSHLAHLDSIGLIQFDIISSFLKTHLQKSGYVQYFDQKIWIELPNPEDNQLNTGKVMFTQVGEQLSNICDPIPVPAFIDYIKVKWQGMGIKVSDHPIITVVSQNT